MRLSRLKTWDKQLDDTTEQKDELNKQILDAYAALEKYDTWEGVEEHLRAEQAKAFMDIMNGDGESVMLARERAKAFSKFLQRREDLQKEITRLHEERNSLEE